MKRALTGTHTHWRPRQHGTANFAPSIPHCRRTTSPVSSRANVEQDCLLWPPPREMATCWPVASPLSQGRAIFTRYFIMQHHRGLLPHYIHYLSLLHSTTAAKGRGHSTLQTHCLSLLHSTTVAKGESIPSYRYIYIILPFTPPLNNCCKGREHSKPQLLPTDPGRKQRKRSPPTASCHADHHGAKTYTLNS